MMVSISRGVLAGTLLSLAACGGSGIGVGGTPTPPPPPPPPNYATLSLTAAETFVATTSTRVAPFGGIAPVSLIGRTGSFTISFDPASQTYTLRDGTTEAVMGPGQYQPDPETFPTPTVTPDARYFGSAPGSSNVSLTIFDNIRMGGKAHVAPIQLSYLSYGQWTQFTMSPPERRDTWFLIGRPTIASDMPRSGAASYSAGVKGGQLVADSGGLGVGSFFPVGGTATFSADFSSGAIQTGLTLQELSDVVPTPIGTFAGTGKIGSGTPDFAGTFTSTNSPLTGDFQGSFYGPQAKEMGYVFQIGGHKPGGGFYGTDIFINGTVAGVKK